MFVFALIENLASGEKLIIQGMGLRKMFVETLEGLQGLHFLLNFVGSLRELGSVEIDAGCGVS